MVNPQPGTLGNAGLNWIEGPRSFRFDLNLLKRTRIDEKRELEFRFDAINVFNHPVFSPPVMDIDNANFGRISSTATDPRSFVLNARINF
jgi:hypothetical protein